MSLAVALDNSVLGDVTDERIPEIKMEDKEAFEKIVELASQGSIELGIALSGALIEERAAGERTRNALRQKLGGILHVWPVIVPSRLHAEIQERRKCLKKIMQDRDGIDSGIFLVSTLHAQYFLTTDYRYHRQFKNQKKRLQDECRITAQVLTPSEFFSKYIKGEFSCIQKDA